MWEPYEVKAQTIKTAIESATLLLRIDDIVSGIAKKNKLAPGQSSAPQTEDPDKVFIPTGLALSEAPGGPALPRRTSSHPANPAD